MTENPYAPPGEIGEEWIERKPWWDVDPTRIFWISLALAASMIVVVPVVAAFVPGSDLMEGIEWIVLTPIIGVLGYILAVLWWLFTLPVRRSSR